MIRFVILIVMTQVSCNMQKGLQHDHVKQTFRVVGFYKGDGQDIDKYNIEQLTHLIFCFTFLEGNKIHIKNDQDEATLKKSVDLKSKHPHLKVMISFGGWGGCETCSDVFASEVGRKEFALSVLDLLKKYDLDGIDVDWESPVIGGYKNHKAAKEDKEHFTQLAVELRKTLSESYEISFDANSFKEFLDLSIDWANVIPSVNFVNLMTYGLPADKSGHTGHHTALYSSPSQSESIDKAIQYMDSLNIPLNKIVIGAAFYSFVVENVDSVDQGLGRKGKFKSNVIYRDLQNEFTSASGYEYHWDSIACAPSLYNNQLKTFVTYDDQRSVALKTKYAINKNLGGIMFWKLNGDMHSNGLLHTIDAEIKNSKK